MYPGPRWTGPPPGVPLSWSSANGATPRRRVFSCFATGSPSPPDPLSLARERGKEGLGDVPQAPLQRGFAPLHSPFFTILLMCIWGTPRSTSGSASSPRRSRQRPDSRSRESGHSPFFTSLLMCIWGTPRSTSGSTRLTTPLTTTPRPPASRFLGTALLLALTSSGYAILNLASVSSSSSTPWPGVSRGIR